MREDQLEQYNSKWENRCSINTLTYNTVTVYGAASRISLYFQLPVLCFVECCITAFVLPVLAFDVQNLLMSLLWILL